MILMYLIEGTILVLCVLGIITLLRRGLRRSRIDSLLEEQKELKLEAIKVQKLNPEEVQQSRKRIRETIENMEDK